MGVATSTAMMAKGLLTWVPGIQAAFYDRGAAHGTGSAAYCYGVWIKHLALLTAHGMDSIPRSVLELGPGESIGAGVAALLSGAERYVAVDAVPHMRAEANLEVFRELVDLFRARAPRPRGGFPPIEQHLDHRSFPGAALGEAHLEQALAPARVARIERAVRDVGRLDPQAMIRYCTWSNSFKQIGDPGLEPVVPGSMDLVFSHVVLNHVEDIEGTYANCARWLRPGGWTSHHVDFTSMGTSAEWNGHRAYSELAWKVIKGKRPYFVNREPVATHVRLLHEVGFDVLRVLRCGMEGGIARADVAPRWQDISDEDHGTQSAFIVARRR